MPQEIKTSTFSIAGLILFEPKVFADNRGYFLETWNQELYAKHGLDEIFMQDNLSYSKKGVLRGLHFQDPKAQGKLVSVVMGEVVDIAVDLRKDSATYGQWESVVLSGENKKQLFIPPGFAHGFYVTSQEAFFSYKCSQYYFPAGEKTLAWNDPTLKIDWSGKLTQSQTTNLTNFEFIQPIVSDKDKQGLKLEDVLS